MIGTYYAIISDVWLAIDINIRFLNLNLNSIFQIININIHYLNQILAQNISK